MTDIHTMPIRELIDELRKKASELGTEHLLTVLWNNAIVARLEAEADRADNAEHNFRVTHELLEKEQKLRHALMLCKPDAEAIELMADTMRAANAPTTYVKQMNDWADAIREADKLIGGFADELDGMDG